MILRHRVKDYHAGDLERVYSKLGIEEDFFIVYGFLTKRVQALMHPRANAGVPAEGSGPWPPRRERRARLLLDFVETRGAVHPREVDSHFSHGTVKNYWGGSSNATTHLLAAMHYRGMLRLNPDDNQGNRDLLGVCYLEANRDADAWDLLNRYPEVITARWTYTAALVQFRMHGDSTDANNALQNAIKENPHVPKYLCGMKRMPRSTPPQYTLGSVDEAIVYADLYGKCWRNSPGALTWLESKGR